MSKRANFHTFWSWVLYAFDLAQIKEELDLDEDIDWGEGEEYGEDAALKAGFGYYALPINTKGVVWEDDLPDDYNNEEKYLKLFCNDDFPDNFKLILLFTPDNIDKIQEYAENKLGMKASISYREYLEKNISRNG